MPALVFPAPGPNNAGTTQWSPAEFGGFDLTGSKSNTPVNLLPWSKNLETSAFTSSLTQIYTATTTFSSGGSVGTYTFGVAATTNISVGHLVYGTGITPGYTYVVGISGTTITLNRPFIAGASGTYLFQDPNAPRTFTSTDVANYGWVSATLLASTNYVFSFYAKAGSATGAIYRVYNATTGLNLVNSTSYYSSLTSNNRTTTATGTISANTITVASATGLYIGMSVSAATGVAIGTKIIAISGTTITMSTVNSGAVSGSITFTDNRLVRISVPFTTPAGNPTPFIQIYFLDSISSGFGTTQISSMQLERGTVATTYQETGPVSQAANFHVAPASKTYRPVSKIARAGTVRAGYQRNVKPAPAVVTKFKTPKEKTQVFRPGAASKVEKFKTPANKTSVLPVDHDINGPRISPALPVEYWNYNNQANIGQADTRVSVVYTPTSSSSTSLLTTLNYTATTYQYLSGDYVKVSDSVSKYSAVAEVLNASQSGPYVDAVNQQQYTTPGTYYWTAPVGVTSVDLVGVGAGAGGGGNAVDTIGGGSSSGGYGGGGGGLGYKNNVTVTPGDTYRVVVGAGGTGSFYCDGINGATSGGNTLFFGNKRSNISFQMISGSTNIYMTVDPASVGIGTYYTPGIGAIGCIIFSQAIGNLAANTSYHITGFNQVPGDYYIVLAPTYWDAVWIVGNTNTTVVCDFESSTAGGFGGTPLLSRTYNATGAPGGYYQGDGGGRGGYGGRMYNHTGVGVAFYTGSGGGGAGGYVGLGGQGGWMSSDTNGLLNLTNGNGANSQFAGYGAGGGVGYPAGNGGNNGGGAGGGGGTDIFGAGLGGTGGGSWPSNSAGATPGTGGSGGANGGLPYTVVFAGSASWGNYGGTGGFPGGGGGGGGGFNGATSGTTYTRIGELGRGGAGANGALRIMWGPTRNYPSSNTANQPVVAYNSGVASITVYNSPVANFNSTTTNWSWIKWLPDVMTARNALTSYPILDRSRSVTRFAEFTMAPGGNYGTQLPYLAYGVASRYLNQSNTTLSPALSSAYWNYNNQANTGQADTRVSVVYTPTGVSRTSLLTTLNYTATAYQYRKGDYVRLSDSATRYTGIAELLNVSTSGALTAPVNQQSYIIPDTYFWTAPVAVTTISVVSVGGGGGGGGPAVNYIGSGGATAAGFGGGGGGLGWKNNITVVPGESYRVVVGAGGIGSYYIGASSYPATAGGPTIFFDNKRSGLSFSMTTGQTDLVMTVSPTSVGIPAVNYAGTPIVFSQSFGDIVANRVYYISDIGTTVGSYYIRLSTYFSSTPGATPITWTATESRLCNIETSNVCGIGGEILANNSSTYYGTGALGGGYKGDGGGQGGNSGGMVSYSGTYIATAVGSGGGGAAGYSGNGGAGGAMSSDQLIHTGNAPGLGAGNGLAAAASSGGGGGGVGYPDGNSDGGTPVVLPYEQVLFAAGTATGTGGSSGSVSGNQYVYTWTCPANVYSVSVACVGSGGLARGGGGQPNGGSGGGSGGGALAWANNIPVVPGQTYTVYSGFCNTAGGTGGNSIFTNDTGITITARGGVGGRAGSYNGGNPILPTAGAGGTYTVVGTTNYGGGNGGAGGVPTSAGLLFNGDGAGGGCGGAGGYNGNGGAGGAGRYDQTNPQDQPDGGTGAGGAGGGGSGTGGVERNYTGGAGGGVGLLGIGSNGAGGAGVLRAANSFGPFPYGRGGVGGSSGGTGGDGFLIPGGGTAAGGNYGGGSINGTCYGAVRIIWPATKISDGGTIRAYGSSSGTTVGAADGSTTYVDTVSGGTPTAGGGSGGGGVNIFGRGLTGGTAGSWAGASATNPGKGGSDGANGNTTYIATYGGVSGWGNFGGNGGFPGGGGGGGGGFNGISTGGDATLYNQLGELGRGGDGGNGALRIMWGPTRTFPTTLAANQLAVEYNSGVSSITISNTPVANFGSVTTNWSWIKWLIDVTPLRNILSTYTGQDRGSPISRLAEFTIAPGGNYGTQLPYLAYGAVNANRTNSRIETTYAQSTVRPTTNPVNARENLYYFTLAPGLRNKLTAQVANTSQIENKVFDVTLLRRLVVVRDPLTKTQQIAIFSPDRVENFYAQSSVSTRLAPANARENLYYFNIAPGLRGNISVTQGELIANTSSIESKIFDVTTLVKPITVLKNPLPKSFDQRVFDVNKIKAGGKLVGINVNLKSSLLGKTLAVLRTITAELNVDNVNRLKIKNTSVNVFSIDKKVGRTSLSGIRLDSPKIDEKIFDPAFLTRKIGILRNPFNIALDRVALDPGVAANFYAQSSLRVGSSPINARENLYYFNLAPGLRSNSTVTQGTSFVDQKNLDNADGKIKYVGILKNPLPKYIDQVALDPGQVIEKYRAVIEPRSSILLESGMVNLLKTKNATVFSINKRIGKIGAVSVIRAPYSARTDALIFDVTTIVRLKSDARINYVWKLDTNVAKLRAASVLRNPLPKILDQKAFDINSLRAVSVLRSPLRDNIIFDSNGILKMEFGKRRGSTGIADVAERRREPLQFWN